MVHRYESNDDSLAPAYAGHLSREPIPKNRMPEGESSSTAVYGMIHDELKANPAPKPGFVHT